jgi:phage terminase large subunit GpA-like protein
LVRPKPTPTIVEWAPQNLRLPAKETSVNPGLFRFEYSPFLAGICDWFNDPSVREITVMACTQAGKTVLTILCLAWILCVAPAHTMIVMPDENTVRRRLKARLRPTFHANPALMQKLDGRIENLLIGEPTVFDEMNLYISWAHSASMMADVPVCHIFADEVGKYPETTGDTEIDPLKLLRERQRTYRNRSKLIKVSSPDTVGDLMDMEFMNGDQCEYWVPCESCRFWHVMDVMCMGLDKGPDGDFLEPKRYGFGGHARYRCPSCGRAWNDYYRAEAVRRGRWLPAGVTMAAGGHIEGEVVPAVHRSCRINAFMVHPRIQSIDELAMLWSAAQIAKRARDLRPLKHFNNSQLGRSWKETAREPDANRLARLVESWRVGRAPAGVQAITIGFDVHPDHIWYAVMGWGYLFEAWLVQAGRLETGTTKEVESYTPAAEMAQRPWELVTGGYLPSALALMDCGFEYDVVLDVCRKWGYARLQAVKGTDKLRARTYNHTAVEGTIRWDLNVDQVKDRLHRQLFETEAQGPGYIHLPADAPPEVFAHWCNEHKVMRSKGVHRVGVWEPVTEHADQHLWDCLVYATAAAMIAGVGERLGPYVPPTTIIERALPEPRRTSDSFMDDLPEL